MTLGDRLETAAANLAERPHTIRDAVKGIERDWETQLGQARFAQLKTLLLELSQPA